MIGDHENPLVSVIIPTFNRANLILETIQSVIDQTYKNLEIIVIDDGSLDNTKEIIAQCKDIRIKYYHKKNEGLPAKSRNFGLKYASGEFIAFLDDDDKWLPEKIEKQIQVFLENPLLKVVCSNGFKWFDGKDTKLYFHHPSAIISLEEILSENWVLNSTSLVKKEVLLEVKGLDDAEILRASEDYDLWIRILDRFPNSIYFLEEPLFLYRIHKDNINAKSNPNAYLEGWARFEYITQKITSLNQNQIDKYIKKKKAKAIGFQYREQLILHEISFWKYLFGQFSLYYKIKGLLYIIRYRKL